MKSTSSVELPRSVKRLPFVFVEYEAFPLMENLMRPFPGQGLDLERKIFYAIGSVVYQKNRGKCI